jgi:DTW domain-containing protein YfiP
MEAKKEKTGTGRASHRFLKNSELLMGVNFNENKRLNELLADKSYSPVVLYPAKNSYNFSKAKVGDAGPGEKRLLIIVIDGTWPCAKKMMKLSTCLHNLPKISFESERTSQFLTKLQPHKFCLSTIESIEVLLSEMQRIGMENLNKAHLNLSLYLQEIVNFQIKCSEDPEKQNYRSKGIFLPTELEPSRLNKGRNIFFNSVDK